MATYLERRWGGGSDNPSEGELREALSELAIPDAEHPDCWLTNDAGWSISAFGSGLVILTNLSESPDSSCHMKNQSIEQVLEIWQLLQKGDIDKIRAKPWLPGFRS